MKGDRIMASIIKAVKTIEKNEISILERTARNCEFYKKEGMTEHLINETGCLRGIMYTLDEIGIPYPNELYYNLYIKPVYEKMTEDEPLTNNK